MVDVWMVERPGQHEYATVRISKIVLDDFKSVRHGEIVLNCGRNFVPAGTESDILGLYGQNGSGKSSLIDALAILKRLMSGSRLPDDCVDCIAAGSESAHVYFEFDFQYPDDRRLKVSYEVSLGREENPAEDGDVNSLSDLGLTDLHYLDVPSFRIRRGRYRVRVFDEQVKVAGLIDNKLRQFRSCIDTLDTSVLPFGPVARHADLMGTNKATREHLAANRILASERSCSFIFMDETLKAFYQDGKNTSDYFCVLSELNLFAKMYLCVVDSSYSASYSSTRMLPFFMPVTSLGGILLPLSVKEPMAIPKRLLEALKSSFVSVNSVLNELIPGLSIDIHEVGTQLLREGEEGVLVDLVSVRDNIEFPLRDESDGIKKIVSTINLYVAAFNEKSVTVAVDEMDAGIFEYLFGEILQIMEESGRGQLIFTSHNLRPLEVLSRKFLYFTTTNPENRYYRMKNVGANNNLRDLYFREIVMQEQDEELYSSAKRYKIVSALRRAGSNAIEA